MPELSVGRHTHPGIETSYVLEGGMSCRSKASRKSYGAGETYQIAAGTPHAGGKASDKKVKIASTYVVEKGKPLASSSLIGARSLTNSFGKTIKSEAALVGGLLPFQTNDAMAGFGIKQTCHLRPHLSAIGVTADIGRNWP